jgi:hypothetical protein
MSKERTCSAVTRFQASALEMSQASPRIGSRRVKKLHGVAPVSPLPARPREVGLKWDRDGTRVG